MNNIIMIIRDEKNARKGKDDIAPAR